MRSITCMAAGALLALVTPAFPAEAAGDDVPITDPALLESLGYEPDAANVYATPQAYEQLLMSPAWRAAVQEMQLAEHAAAQGGATAGPFGTATVGYSPISGAELVPFGSDAGFRYTDGRGRYCLTPSPWAGLVSQFTDMPHGARLEDVRVWFWDTSDDDLRVHVRRVCHPDAAAGLPTTTILGTIESAFAPGHGTAVIGPLAEDVDHQSCVYEALAVLGVDSGCPGNDSLAISKIRAQWRRQISPAPATATFGDVPTSHPFFQHIEALAASEITGGCDAENFCPNAPVTRGQMAVFLAKALGLHWGGFE
jgi:hypothetical protein